TDNYLDVLIVNHNTLQTINILHFVGNIFRQFNNAKQTQNIVRIRRSIRDHLTLLNLFTFEHVHLTILVDKRLIRIRSIMWCDYQSFLTFSFLTETDYTADFG